MCGVYQGALELEDALSQILLTPLTLNLSLLLQRAKEKPGLGPAPLWLQVPDMGHVPGGARACPHKGPARPPDIGAICQQADFCSGVPMPPLLEAVGLHSGPSPHKAMQL